MKPSPAIPGLLFGSYLYRGDLFSPDIFHTHWKSHFGESETLTPSINPLTSYYEKEMGKGLERVFFVSKNPFPRETLLETKLQALTWEDHWRVLGGRTVNVDIGLLSLENFLLATTKPYSHRIYLGQNIYADLTYLFQKKSVEVLPWTYPDYQDEEKKAFFWSCRKFIRSVD